MTLHRQTLRAGLASALSHVNRTQSFNTMTFPAFIKIIKINEKREGVKEGRPWAMQDCECVALDENGEMLQVGVLQLPKPMLGENAPQLGTYIPVFALQVGLRDRKIGVGIVDLKLVPARSATAPAAAPATAKA